VEIGGASKRDLDRVLDLLKEAGLPQSGVAQIITQFKVVRDHGVAVGAGVIERHGPSGLLRSMVVDPRLRGKGIGGQIVSSLLSGHSENVYLLTETAESFFVRFGFETISRDEAPAELRASEEFRCLCPESAAFMRRLGNAASKS